MQFQYLIDEVAIEFYLLTGINLNGILGLFLGLGLFSFLMFLIKYKKKTLIINPDVSNLSDVGDPDYAKINLSRSLIEMDQKEKAQEILLDLLLNKTLSEEKKKSAESLLNKI